MSFFGPVHLLSTERSIRVDTRLGNAVKNVVAPDSTPLAAERYRLFRKRFGANWRNRRGACGQYNCWGHLFASRRTAIYEDDEVERVLRDDGYRRIEECHVRVGDLVLYRLGNGALLHGAQVVRIESTSAGTRVPFVLTKWDDTFGEDEHQAYDVPYERQSLGRPLVQFWSERCLTP